MEIGSIAANADSMGNKGNKVGGDGDGDGYIR
jgi:hypothetical protein